jgi:hypothetical protein
MKSEAPLTSSILHEMVKKQADGFIGWPVTTGLSSVKAVDRGLLSSSEWEVKFGFSAGRPRG